MSKINPVLKVVGVAIVMAFFISFFFHIGFYSNLEVTLSDNLYGGMTPLNTIVIVAIDDPSLQSIGRWPWDRDVFAEILPVLNESKVIGMDIALFEEQDNESDGVLASAVASAGNVILPVEYTSFDVKDDDVIGTEVLTTIPVIADESLGLAYINVITDVDGKTRALNPVVVGEYESFSHAVYDAYWNVPVDIDGLGNRMLINYVGKPGSFRSYSFVDVLNRKYSPSEFKDKIVLIGATSPDLHDEALVPNSHRPMNGVEIHANAIQTLITKKYLSKEPYEVVIFSIFLTALVTALVFFFLPVLISPFVMFGYVVAYLFLAIVMFNYGLILNIIYVPMTVLLSYLVVSLYNYVAEKKQRKQVLGAFEKYVSKDVISHILDDPSRLKLGGEKREITVFFSDIRGFTSISEKLKPEDLVKLLNEYLTEMTDIVLENNGVVDKYMGDAIMAFWGAPLDQPKHALRACKTAFEMGERLEELQKKWSAEGVPKLEIGIGLNSGHAVVGNMGSADRFDYTAMGDTINLGSRLESINKQYGTRIIISEPTKKLISDEKEFIVRKLDMVKVKGKKEPITIYELVAHIEDYVIKHFEKGLSLYFKQKWDEAVKEFKLSLSHRKDDGPSLLFIDRCKYFKKHPPAKDWDGVWEMKTK